MTEARISVREVFDALNEARGDIVDLRILTERLVDALPKTADDVAEHSKRIAALEVAQATQSSSISAAHTALSTTAGDVSRLADRVGQLAQQVSRQAWLPGIMSGLIVAAGGGAVVALLIP